MLFVVSDGSLDGARALDAVRRLAERRHVPVEVLTVESPGVNPLVGRSDVDRICERVGLHATVTVLFSNDVQGAVADHLEQWTVDEHAAGRDAQPLLCLASHGRGPIAELLVGSFSESFVRVATGPVLLIGPRSRAITVYSERLLVCLDGSVASEQILPVAASWTRSFGGAVRLLRVVEPDDEEESRAARHQLEAAAAWFTAQAIDVEIELHTSSSSSAADVITESASTFGISAVAMATRGRGRLQRIGLGSVALRVLRDVVRPVVLVNPHADLE